MASPAHTLRKLRQRQEQAEDWIHYASWGAFGTAGLGVTIALISLIEDGATLGPATLLASAASLAAVGWKLRQHSSWAAWVLMVNYIIVAIVHSVTVSLVSGLLLKIALTVVYVRGFIAAEEWHDLEAAITKAIVERDAEVYTPPAA